MGHIRKKGNLHGAETSLLTRDVGPGEESVRGVLHTDYNALSTCSLANVRRLINAVDFHLR